MLWSLTMLSKAVTMCRIICCKIKHHNNAHPLSSAKYRGLGSHCSMHFTLFWCGCFYFSFRHFFWGRLFHLTTATCCDCAMEAPATSPPVCNKSEEQVHILLSCWQGNTCSRQGIPKLVMVDRHATELHYICLLYTSDAADE